MVIVPQVVPHVQSLPDWIEYVRALGTPTVALIAAAVAGFIAFRQMQIARNKLKLDLFDKRVAVYKAAIDLIRSIGLSNQLDEIRAEEIATSLNSSSWLLNDRVEAYLLQLTSEIEKQRTKERMAFTGLQKIALISENKSFRDKHRKEVKKVFEPFLKLQH